MWRLVSAEPTVRWRFAVKVGCGGLCACLLAMPVILPFLQYLALASVGSHGGALPGLVQTSPAAFLFPTVFGPPGYATEWVQWGTAGGFFALPLAAIASLALLRGGADYGLRVLLAAWCAAALAKSADLPLVTQAFDLIPFVRQIWFARYAVPSWELACVILTAFALHVWQMGRLAGGRAIVAVGVIWALIAAWALHLAWPVMQHLRAAHPAYLGFVAASLGGAAITGAASAWILARPYRRGSAGVLMGLLGAQAAVIAMLPLAAGARGASYDKAAVKFLQAHIGLSRFYTLGPFAPNYGAFFAIASINHNMLPIPRLWVDYVRAHLDPALVDDLFTGWIPTGAVAGETRIDALRHRLGAYAAIGVKYVLAPPGSHPFDGGGLTAPLPARVFADGTMDIYELANPAPYVETRGGPCELVALTRDDIRASCRAPAQLIRRELFFPGWHADMSGARLPITMSDEVFQAVFLPAGNNVITYFYAPPGIVWAYGCFAAGMLWLFACLPWRRQRQ